MITDIRLKYQNSINQVTKFFFTAYLAINTLLIAYIKEFKVTLDNLYIYFAAIGIIIFIILFWYLKLESLKKLLLSDIEYLKTSSKEHKDYFDFIEKQMDMRKRKKQINVIFPSYYDDLFPLLCGIFTVLTVILAAL